MTDPQSCAPWVHDVGHPPIGLFPGRHRHPARVAIWAVHVRVPLWPRRSLHPMASQQLCVACLGLQSSLEHTRPPRTLSSGLRVRYASARSSTEGRPRPHMLVPVSCLRRLSADTASQEAIRYYSTVVHLPASGEPACCACAHRPGDRLRPGTRVSGRLHWARTAACCRCAPPCTCPAQPAEPRSLLSPAAPDPVQADMRRRCRLDCTTAWLRTPEDSASERGTGHIWVLQLKQASLRRQTRRTA